jgi:chromosome partitioning protein
MDDLRPTLGLAKRLARLRDTGEKIVLVLSKTGRSERLVDSALALIEESGFSCLSVHWPQRAGFPADLDAGRAGSESSNPHLKQAAAEIEAAMLACL